MDSALIGIAIATSMGLFVGYFIGYLRGEEFGYKDGIRWNRYLFDHMHEVEAVHKKERDEYRDIAIGLCEHETDCEHCPFKSDNCAELCKLWEIERRRGLS